MLGKLNYAEPGTSAKTLEKVRVQRSDRVKSRWAGVPHGEMLQCMKKAGKSLGMEFGSVVYYLTRSGADIALTIDVDLGTVPHVKFRGQEYKPFIGFTASNAARGRLRVYAGMHSTTGPEAYCGWTALGGMYTKEYDPDADMLKIVTQLNEQFKEKVYGRFETLRKTQVSRKYVDPMLLEAGSRGCVTWKSMKGIIEKLPKDQDLEVALLSVVTTVSGVIATTSPPPYQLQRMLAFAQLVEKISAERE